MLCVVDSHKAVCTHLEVFKLPRDVSLNFAETLLDRTACWGVWQQLTSEAKCKSTIAPHIQGGNLSASVTSIGSNQEVAHGSGTVLVIVVAQNERVNETYSTETMSAHNCIDGHNKTGHVANLDDTFASTLESTPRTVQLNPLVRRSRLQSS